MSDDSKIIRKVIRKESLLLTGLLFVGFVLVPVAIYWVGRSIFGAYGGQGYGDFFGTISQKVRSGDRVAWFLILSPYLFWQCLRLTVSAWRRLGRTP